MAVLTKLSQFEQYDLEELVCDAIQCLRGTASKVVAEVFVPELEKRLHSARTHAHDSAIADIARADRIANTPLDELNPADIAWYRAPEQTAIREIGALPAPPGQRQALVEWLRNHALRSDT